MSEMLNSFDLKSAKIIELCDGFTLCKGIKKRTVSFMILVCLQTALTGVYFMYSYSSIVRGIQIDIEHLRNNNVADLSRDKNSWIFRLENQETLGKFYFEPEAGSKKLYMLNKGNIIPVDVSTSVAFEALARKVINLGNCTITNQNITLETYSTVPNCRKVHKDIEDVSYFAFQEEIDVQIAYSILVYKDYQMVEFLLRAIYKPQNTYCIHVDNKSPKFFENSVRGLATCFQNVFIATKPVNVYWGNFSVVEAEMSCMKDLLNKSKSWKYFINLTGQEFPLRTNYEIAKVLIALRGYNNMKCSDRIKKSDLLISGAPPYGLTAYKTSTHVVLTREFVEYILYNKTAKAVLNWTKQLKIPSDEIAFSTLNCNQKLKAPGSYGGHPNVYNRTLNYIARFKVWIGKSFHVCNGKSLRGICTFGPKDLETLHSRYELFANKFNIRAFPQVPYCLRNTLLRRTFLEYTGRLDYNVTYYENIPHRI